MWHSKVEQNVVFKNIVGHWKQAIRKIKGCQYLRATFCSTLGCHILFRIAIFECHVLVRIAIFDSLNLFWIVIFECHTSPTILFFLFSNFKVSHRHSPYLLPPIGGSYTNYPADWRILSIKREIKGKYFSFHLHVIVLLLPEIRQLYYN